MPIIDNSPPPVKKTGTTAVQRKATATTGKRTEALAGLGPLIQAPLLLTKKYADAGAVAAHWDNVGSELAKLADTVPAIAKIIDPLLQAGPYAGLIAAVLPLAMQLGVNHGFGKAGAMGTVPPTTLSAQIETGLAKAELQALIIQRDAEREAAKVRAEIEESRKAIING